MIQNQAQPYDGPAALPPGEMVANEKLSFEESLNAIPEVLEIRSGSWASRIDTDVVLRRQVSDEDDEETFCVDELADNAMDVSPVLVITERHAVYGALVYDQHAENPMEDCASGKLFHKDTSVATRQDRERYFQALGYTREEEKDLDRPEVLLRISNMISEQRLVDRSMLGKLNRILKKYGIKRTTGEAIHEAVISGGKLENVVEAFVGQWSMPEPEELSESYRDCLESVVDLVESLAERAWDAAFEAGEVKERFAVEISTCSGDAVWVPDTEASENIEDSALFELTGGCVRYVAETMAPLPTCPSSALIDLMGGGPSLRKERKIPAHYKVSLDGKTFSGNFANRRRALDGLTEEMKKSAHSAKLPLLGDLLKQKATRYAEGVVEAYNAWANGDVFGVVVHAYDRETGQRIEDDSLDRSSWGYLGAEYATSELESCITGVVKQLVATTH